METRQRLPSNNSINRGAPFPHAPLIRSAQCRRKSLGARLYELFINCLRHPYRVCPMLTASMTIHKDKEQGLSPRRNSEGHRLVLVRLPRRAEQPKGEDMNALVFVRQSAQVAKIPKETGRRRLEIAQS